MTSNFFSLSIVCFISIAFTACAQPKKSVKETAGPTKQVKAHTDAKPTLIQATSQKTLGGREETPPITEYRFLIVWNSTEEVGGFFWRGEQTWMPCEISKVKNYKPLDDTEHEDPYYINYEPDKNSGNTYAKGDTLELFPVTGGKYPIPEEISLEANNIIYYKTGNSKWKALPVEKITKLPTITMP